MNYGRFSSDNKEYIIENAETPSPWINYIYNGRYFASISNNGGGISYLLNPLHGRITRYRINDIPHDRPGKYIYIKDRDSGEVWSATWQPVGKSKESYKLIHGFGYTKSVANLNDISSSALFFVPPDDDLEIWKLSLENHSRQRRRLSVYAYVEFALGHALIDIINQCDDQHFNRVRFDDAINGILATKTYWVTDTTGTQHQENKAWDQYAFFTSNLPVVGYESLRERFIGLYRNENSPIGIESGILSNRDTDFGNAVGVLQVDLELNSSQSEEIVFTLGVMPKDKIDSVKNILPRKYHNLNTIESAFNKMQNNWDKYLNFVRITTPDESANTFINYWTPYQAKVAFDIGRVASFYYWGLGRGFGYRDTAQDTIAATISYPEKAKERISILARQMFSDGRVYHHFFNDGQGELTGHTDDPLWFILALTDYLKETGDLCVLEEVEPYADGKSAKIIERMEAILSFIRTHLGPHGLPLFGRGDWNDTLDYIGGDEGGESVWAAMFYVAMLSNLIELAGFLGMQSLQEKSEELHQQLINAINDSCWDGEWYIRAFGAKSRKIGSRQNKYGQIFLNAQSWAVIAQVADKDKLITALDSVYKYLDTEYGPKICAPAFKEIDPSVGLISRCVAGKKENGAIFGHPVPWLIQSECMLGRGNRAFHYYKKMLPNTIDSDIFVAEPYVYSQYITSDEHESDAGRASHSWQTGTAAWMFRVVIDYMIGVRPTYEGLLIDPVIPSQWRNIKVERVYRGTRYKIEIENPEEVENGIQMILIDGVRLRGNIIPVSNESECHVKVTMGEKVTLMHNAEIG
jgi:cellobiose phosphorylase